MIRRNGRGISRGEKEYTPTRMDEYYTVEDSEPQPLEERAELG
jgi:hypothetical protein